MKSNVAIGAVEHAKRVAHAHRHESLPDGHTVLENYCFVIGKLDAKTTMFTDVAAIFLIDSLDRPYWFPVDHDLFLARIVPSDSTKKKVKEWFDSKAPGTEFTRRLLATVFMPLRVPWDGPCEDDRGIIEEELRPFIVKSAFLYRTCPNSRVRLTISSDDFIDNGNVRIVLKIAAVPERDDKWVGEPKGDESLPTFTLEGTFSC